MPKLNSSNLQTWSRLINGHTSVFELCSLKLIKLPQYIPEEETCSAKFNIHGTGTRVSVNVATCLRFQRSVTPIQLFNAFYTHTHTHTQNFKSSNLNFQRINPLYIPKNKNSKLIIKIYEQLQISLYNVINYYFEIFPISINVLIKSFLLIFSF